MKAKLKYAIPAAALSLGPFSAVQADKVLLNFETDIPGDSVFEQHEDWIELIAWSWGIERNIDLSGGSQREVGNVSLREFKVIKYIDVATAPLALRAVTGQSLGDATIHVIDENAANGAEYIAIVLSEAIISKIAQGVDAANNQHTETLSINYTKVNFSYAGVDGKSPQSWCWDLMAQVGC